MKAILVPQISANEVEAQVVEIDVSEHQWVEPGQMICALETTKAVFEVIAEDSGYVHDLRIAVGDIVRVGGQICMLVETLDQVELTSRPIMMSSDDVVSRKTERVPEDLRISKAALELAQRLQVDLGKLPRNQIVTSAMIQELTGGSEKYEVVREARREWKSGRNLVLFGGGGHAKMLVDLLRQQTSFNLVGIVDDAIPPGETVMGVPVLGDSSCLEDLLSQGIVLSANGLGSTKNLESRIRVSERLRELGFILPAIVHPRSIVEPSTQLEDGAQILAGAYVGSEAVIEHDCVINTGAIVSHHCQIGPYSTISPGTLLAAEVKVGMRCLVGMGVKVNTGVRIGDGCQIGNGAIIHFDVPERTIVRTSSTWPQNHEP